MASSVANDVIMRMVAASARRHNENDIAMTTADLWRYGDWRHVETRPFCQTQNPGLRVAETQVSGLFSAAFCTFQQQIMQQFNAFH